MLHKSSTLNSKKIDIIIALSLTDIVLIKNLADHFNKVEMNITLITDGKTMNRVLVSVSHSPKKLPIKLIRRKSPTALCM